MSLGLDESKAKDVAREAEVETNYRTLRIIWLAILASVIVIFIVTRLMEPSAAGGDVLFWILMALGLFSFGSAFIMKHRMLKQAIEKKRVDLVRSAYIVALALCEATSLYGLFAHMATGARQYYFLFVLSGFGILMHKPQRDDLLAALNGGGVWEARKND